MTASPVSLIDRIKNRSLRTIKLDLGYDEVNSEKLAVIEGVLGNYRNVLERTDKNIANTGELKKLRTELRRRLKAANPEEAGQIEADIAEVQEKLDQYAELDKGMEPLRQKAVELQAQVDEVTAIVKANSLSIEVRALPTVIARGSARRARKYLGITEKNIPEAKQNDFEERQLIELAYDQVVRWRDNSTGEEGTKLDMEVIETLRDFLPLTQSSKFFQAVQELQFRNAISEQAIQQADF